LTAPPAHPLLEIVGIPLNLVCLSRQEAPRFIKDGAFDPARDIGGEFFVIRRIDPIRVISALPHIHIRIDDICHRGVS
jgi:hypothetical protein